jgi:hypothetical protein
MIFSARNLHGNGMSNFHTGSMYGIYTYAILMVNVTIYSIHGSYGIWLKHLDPNQMRDGNALSTARRMGGPIELGKSWKISVVACRVVGPLGL